MTSHVTCFGGLFLRDASERLLPLSRRRADALLARLIWDQGRPIPRATLVSLLWPERRDTGGSALRQSVHVLRGALGQDAIETSHKHVLLTDEAVSSDLGVLRSVESAAAALALRETATAGGFLAGLRAASHEHAAWLTDVRERADALAADALAALARLELDDGRPDQAIRSARAALSLSPGSEQTLALVLDAARASGDAAVARREVEAFKRRYGPPTEAVTARLNAHARAEAEQTEQLGANLTRPVIAIGVVWPDDARDVEARIAETLERAGAHDLLCRHNTATALFGEKGLRQTTVTSAVNVATELTRGAPPASVGLCLARTHVLSSGPIRLREVDRARALALADGAAPGGLDADLAVAGLSGAEAVAGRDGVRRDPVAHPFAGRRAELTQIDAIWRAVAQEGRAQVLAISGAPGIGKSRLLAEQRAAMPAEAGVMIGPASGPTDRSDILARLIAALGVGNGEGANDREGRGPFERVCALLDHRVGPTLIAIEDAEEIAKSNQDALADVIERLRDRRLLWVFLARCDTPGALPLMQRLAGRAPTTELFLSHLSQEEVFELSEGYAITQADREMCVAQADGNPLFLTQILQHKAEGADATCPASVEEAIATRLASLDTRSMAMLRLLAVMGENTPDRALRELAEAGDAVIEGLIRGRLVRRDAGELVFEHGLIRAALLTGTPEKEQREIHRRAARWFRDKDGERRAWHLWAAGEADAAQALLDAAKQARLAGRAAAAAKMASAGVGATKSKVLQARLRVEEGLARTADGLIPEADQAFKAALRATLDRGVRADALIGAANLHRLLDEATRGLNALKEAEPLLQTIEQRARLLITRGRLLYVSGSWRESVDCYREAQDFAQKAQDPALEADTFGGLADAAYALGSMHEAERNVRSAIEVAERAGRKSLVTTQRSMLAHILIYDARIADGERMAVDAARDASASSDWRSEINAQLGVASAAFCRGDLPLCATAARRVEELAAGAGAKRFLLVAGLYHARVAIARGAIAEARDLLDGLRGLLDATSAPIHLPQFALLCAIAGEDRGDLAGLLTSAEARLSPHAAAHNAFRVLPVAALLWRRLGEDAKIAAALAALRNTAASELPGWCAVMADAIDALRRGEDVSGARARAAAHGFLRLSNVLGGDSSLGALLVC